MKQTPQHSPDEIRKAFAQLRRDLHPGVVDGIRTAGFRESMLEEYRELADTARDLIAFLGQNGFQSGLDNVGRSAYAEIMARFSVCGQRIRLVIEESNSKDRETVLALSPAASKRLN